MRIHANRIEVTIWPERTASVDLFVNNEEFTPIRRLHKKSETKREAIKRAKHLQKSIKFPIYIHHHDDDSRRLFE